jgi:hypothetical protein
MDTSLHACNRTFSWVTFCPRLLSTVIVPGVDYVSVQGLSVIYPSTSVDLYINNVISLSNECCKKGKMTLDVQ